VYGDYRIGGGHLVQIRDRSPLGGHDSYAQVVVLRFVTWSNGQNMSPVATTCYRAFSWEK